MKQLETFSDANQWLDQFHAHASGPYRLSNIKELMRQLGNPQENYPVVHIAGTSGKTSTVYYMTALLVAAGKSVGTTVSPHVDEINERIQINGQPISEETFCEALTEFGELVEPSDMRLSWFEVMVSFAYWYFAQEKVDYAVIEVGLGGLLDGTNIIRREDKVCIVTDIGLDHVAILGNTLKEIAAQKIGIAQPGNAVFAYRQQPKVDGVLTTKSAEQGAKLYQIDSPTPLPAAGVADFQYRNWYLANCTYNYLKKRDSLSDLTRQALHETQMTQIPGRMQIMKFGDKTILMDGAHNQQKMSTFLASFKQEFPDQRPAVLLALKDDKDAKAVSKLLGPITDHVIITEFSTTQDTQFVAQSAADLKKVFEHAGIVEVKAIPDIRQAVNELLTSESRTLIITGSFYLLSQIRKDKLLA